MNRYIRTKDGKIFDLARNAAIGYNELGYCILDRADREDVGYYFDIKEIKEADTIEELIEVGDLVEIDYVIEICTEKVCQPDRVRKANVEALYTKQGNNYILVAKKENGDWRVI